MFAPTVAKTQTATAEESARKPTKGRLMPVASSGGPSGEHAQVLQANLGNQATLRLLARQAAAPGGETDGGERIEAPELGAGVALDLSPRDGAGPVLARQPQNEAPPAAPANTQAGAAAAPTSAQAEREREVEAISVGKTSYVLYQTKVRGGGSSSWLANNPGNLDYTENTVAWGCYEGKGLPWGQHRFAIFPDEETGMGAVRKFLRKFQTTRDITLMMNLFAPATDQNNPTEYSEKVAKHIGGQVTVHTLVKDLTDDQIQLFAEAIQTAEGWTPGPVNDVPRGDPSLPEEVRNR